MPFDVEFIRTSIESEEYEFSLHADEERLAEGLTVLELEAALRSAELLEDYPNDPRGPSCLVLGHTNEKSLHVVCGRTKQGRLFIITVYLPTMPKWRDERNRNRTS